MIEMVEKKKTMATTELQEKLLKRLNKSDESVEVAEVTDDFITRSKSKESIVPVNSQKSQVKKKISSLEAKFKIKENDHTSNIVGKKNGDDVKVKENDNSNNNRFDGKKTEDDVKNKENDNSNHISNGEKKIEDDVKIKENDNSNHNGNGELKITLDLSKCKIDRNKKENEGDDEPEVTLKRESPEEDSTIRKRKKERKKTAELSVPSSPIPPSSPSEPIRNLQRQKEHLQLEVEKLLKNRQEMKKDIEHLNNKLKIQNTYLPLIIIILTSIIIGVGYYFEIGPLKAGPTCTPLQEKIQNWGDLYQYISFRGPNRGDPGGCWKEPPFTPEICCSPWYGPRGHPGCWDGATNHENCCKPHWSLGDYVLSKPVNY